VAVPGCATTPTRLVANRPWAQDRLDAERVWPLTTGRGQRVAVVDTGVDGHHPQLNGRVDPGVDVWNGQRADDDCHGHGTFVAGIIAAGQMPGTGFAGVAPGVTIVPIRETSTDSVRVDKLATAIDLAARWGGITVINVSTTTSVDDPGLRAAVRHALQAGIVVVAAAGNDAQAGNAAKYPAVYPGVLSVGAIDKAGNRAQFSETVGVGVVAPGGQDVVSTGAGGTGQVNTQTGGTSYAAPFVTGVAALVRAYHPELTPAQVVHRIEATADHPAGTLPDPQFGWGVVNPYAAVTAVLPDEGGRPVAAPSRSPVPLSAPAIVDVGPRAEVAYGLAGAALALLLLGYAALRLVPAGRRRGWRSALRD
jgi:membrane-anchored mycosin MYCP